MKLSTPRERTRKPRDPILTEIKHLAEVCRRLPAGSDRARVLLNTASSGLVRAVVGEKLDYAIMFALTLRSVIQTGGFDSYIVADTPEIADWATKIRLHFALEDLRRRGLASIRSYPADILNDNIEASFEVVSPVPDELTDMARLILMHAREKRVKDEIN